MLAVWLGSSFVVVLVIAGAFMGWSRSTAHAPAGGAAPQPKAVPEAPRETVPFDSLEGIDIRWTLDQAKTKMPEAVPRAEPDVHKKEYTIELDHPVLTRVIYNWEWGCTCLDHIVFHFKDYATRQRIGESFLPCLERAHGAPTKSAPPFDYEWEAVDGAPRLHLGPQVVSVDPTETTTQAGYRKVIGALGGCGT
jgi:hypothetical protein